MQDFNYHTHTYRCKHAEKDFFDEEYVKLFIEKGFKKIAFTDHCPEKEVIDKRTKMRMDYSQKDEYLASIKSLKEKYKDRIEIETGYEIEYLPGQEENLFELKEEVDKIILGQHFVFNDDRSDLVKFRYVDFTDEELLRYAEYIERALELGLPDIIAHPDLYMMGRENFGEIEREVAKRICAAAEKYDVPIEINLAEQPAYDIGRIPKVTYPCKEFWQIASNYNLRVLYGIDAHYRIDIIQYEKSVAAVNEIIGKDIISKLRFVDKDLKIIEKDDKERE